MNAFFGRAAGAILSLSLLSAPAAQAQDAYPNKPVKVIVHTLPGASSDVLARAVSKPWATSWARASWSRTARAGGAIGVDAVAKAAPDGYTLLAGASSAMVMLPIVLTRKLPYDENKDFAPIGVISRSPFLLVASQASASATCRTSSPRPRRIPARSPTAARDPAPIRTCWANCSASWPASS